MGRATNGLRKDIMECNCRQPCGGRAYPMASYAELGMQRRACGADGPRTNPQSIMSKCKLPCEARDLYV
eukprot:11718681-Alexandrium_andersonii.AAC.1